MTGPQEALSVTLIFALIILHADPGGYKGVGMDLLMSIATGFCWGVGFCAANCIFHLCHAPVF